MIFLTLSTLLLASFALPLHSATVVTCVPADFKSVLIFFLANYIAHAATVPSVAGGCLTLSALWIMSSLFYPFAGLLRSIVLVHDYTLAEGEIGKAISQRAVMVAARKADWVPRFTRDELVYVGLLQEFPENTDRAELPKARFHTLSSISAINTKRFKLHGETSLPEGYIWSKPETSQLNALASRTLDREGIKVGRSNSIVKGFASVAQLIFSSITIYRARGSQLERYGYAAFGLSVFPYALMTLVNLAVVTVIGEYSTLFVLRTAISDEAKRCGGRISGEIGTLPEATQLEATGTVGSPIEDGSSITMEIGNDGDLEEGAPEVIGSSDGEKEHLLGEVNKTTTTGNPPETTDIGSGGTGGEGTDGPGVPMKDAGEVFLSGKKPFIAAKLWVEKDGETTILVVTMKGRTGRFKLIEGKAEEHDDPLTFNFYVSAVTNQEVTLERGRPWRPSRDSWHGLASLIYILLFFILVILPYVFIFFLTNFRKGDSTSAQRGWMMSWLVFSQVLSLYALAFSLFDPHVLSNLPQAALVAVAILVYATPAIGGFVTVGRMLLEFGTCSLPK